MGGMQRAAVHYRTRHRQRRTRPRDLVSYSQQEHQGVKTFTQAQVIEITMTVLKYITEHNELTPDEIEHTALRINKGVIKGLEDAGVILLWRRGLRKN
jgi:hypothetical protein